MKIVLATGIYPPALGGPATYVHKLAEQLVQRGVEVEIVTFARANIRISEYPKNVHVVPLGLPVLRWFVYATALRKVARDADVVYCFSTVSTGAPLLFARLRGVKKILRLGGDFLWERYTDGGGRKGLRELYETNGIVHWFCSFLVLKLLKQFDHIVFSTAFQQEIYQKAYKGLPPHSVIRNAVDVSIGPLNHELHSPMRLLTMCRFVKFKNIPALLEAVHQLSSVSLTIAGDGPERFEYIKHIAHLQLEDRVSVLPPVHSEKKQQLFAEHDAFIVPSLTDISPNAALEALASGLPVLITKETGLSAEVLQHMHVFSPLSPESIAEAIEDVRQAYPSVNIRVAGRSWKEVAEEHIHLFKAISEQRTAFSDQRPNSMLHADR